MEHPYRVYIGLNEQYGYSRNILRGVHSYNKKSRRKWRFRHGQIYDNYIPSIINWKPDGMIVQCSSSTVDEILYNCEFPVINVSTVLSSYRLPTVAPDNGAAGALAAEHLINCGLKQFAYWPFAFEGFFCERAAGFVKVIKDKEFQVHNPPKKKNADIISTEKQLSTWLQNLPKPIGILCTDDIEAAQVCEACFLTGIRVPDEVAIIGVGDEVFECEIAPIALTSVTLPSERIGYEAMALLERMLNGESAPTESLRFAPLGVTMRSSTHFMAIGDKYVEEVISYINQYASSALSIADIAARIPLSRRDLERRFQYERGHTMGDEIHHARVQIARSLLLDTDLKIATIAVKAGFMNCSYFARKFREIIGVTPLAFRLQARGTMHR
ncbi:MAG: DNA-binding transcriptional regulator [bacterium]